MRDFQAVGSFLDSGLHPTLSWGMVTVTQLFYSGGMPSLIAVLEEVIHAEHLYRILTWTEKKTLSILQQYIS